MRNDAAASSMTSSTQRRGLQGVAAGNKCPCDCTESLDNGAEEAFLIQGPLGNAFCIPAASWADILMEFPGIVCSPEEEIEQVNGRRGDGCTEDFIVLPFPGDGGDGGGGDGGLWPFDDSFQFDDAFLGGGLLDENLLPLFDDALALDDILGDIVLPFDADAP
jgi:hypothetical protein